MPKVRPEIGQAVEETTVTRIVNESKSEQEKIGWDALEYMDSVTPEKWSGGDHIIYVYRVEPILYRGASGPAYVTKYASPVTLEQIQKEYGGGLFRIVIKRGQERMADTKYQLSGTPRDLSRGTQEFSPAAPGGVPQSDQSVISQAMQMATNPTARAAEVDMLRTAASSAIDMVRAQAPQQMTVKDILELANTLRGPAHVEKPFLETEVGRIVVAAASALVTALVNRVVTPTDPLDQLTKMATVMQSLGGGNSSGSDWKAALVNAAPQIANAVKDTVQELRLGTEAQMRLNAGRTLAPAPPPAAAPAQQNPAAPQNVVEMPQQPQVAQGAQPMEPFELKLIELLNDPNMTGDKAGEILDQTWPRFVDEISTYNVDMVIHAFKVRPLLQPHADNPRLRQFVMEFLAWAKDTEPLTPGAPSA